MAFGAAPTSDMKGIPAAASAVSKMTSGATPRYGAMASATGNEIAMAATFIMRLAMIRIRAPTPTKA